MSDDLRILTLMGENETLTAALHQARATLDAVRALADTMGDRDDVYAEQEHPNETVVIKAVPVHELRAILDVPNPRGRG